MFVVSLFLFVVSIAVSIVGGVAVAVAVVVVAVAVVAIAVSVHVVVVEIATVRVYFGAMIFWYLFAGSCSADDPAVLPEARGTRKGKESRCGCVRGRFYVAPTAAAAAADSRFGKSTARAT